MDEQEFRRLLDLFPVVRPRDYRMDLDTSRESTSRPPPDQAPKEWQEASEDGDHEEEMESHAIGVNDAFWEKLRLAVEKKVGAEEAKRFCVAFQQVHRKLVYEELSLDAAHSFIRSSKS